MTKSVKVIVYGLNKSGKTTFVEVIKDKHIVDGTSFRKKQQDSFGEVIFTDYGEIYIDKDSVIRLYSQAIDAPDIASLIANSASIIILNPTKEETFSSLLPETKLLINKTKKSNKPCILVSSKRKIIDSYSVAELREMLEIPDTIPFLECDPVTEPSSAKRVLLELLKMLPEDELARAAIAKLESEL